MKFSVILQDLRKSKGLNQLGLAKALGVSRSTISMYECGEREPDFETMEAIADFFNVDMNYLHGLQKQKSLFSCGFDNLTEHEAEIIEAYRSKPELQPAVDKLLLDK